MRKYELTENSLECGGRILRQIKAVKSFYTASGEIVRWGDLGGFIESEENLSHEGGCWVASNANVFDDARVEDDAVICASSVCHGSGVIRGYALVSDHCDIGGECLISDHAKVSFSKVIEDARICRCSEIQQECVIGGYSIIIGHTRLYRCKCLGENMLNGSSYCARTFLTDTTLRGYCRVYDSRLKNATVAGSLLIDSCKLLDTYVHGLMKVKNCFIGNGEIQGNGGLCDVDLINSNVKVSGFFENMRIDVDCELNNQSEPFGGFEDD